MQKPTSIIVFGILQLVLAGLGLLASLYNLASPYVTQQSSPALAEAYTGTVLVLTVAMVGIGLLSKSLMAGSGFGLLKDKPWALQVGNLWAIASIALGLIFLIINMVVIMPEIIPTLEKDLQHQMGTKPPPALVQATELGTYIAVVVGGLISFLPYQITYLIMMNRKPVKDYFAGLQGGGGQGPMDEAQAAPPAPTDW